MVLLSLNIGHERRQTMKFYEFYRFLGPWKELIASFSIVHKSTAFEYFSFKRTVENGRSLFFIRIGKHLPSGGNEP